MSDTQVIALIAKNFVPVAVNLYMLREAKDEYGQLYQSINKQKPQYQGFWIVAPNGKVLAGHQDKKNAATWTDEVLADLNKGLKAFGTVEPRTFVRHDPQPLRGVGFHINGEVTLALYIREKIGGKLHGSGVLDSLKLTARELDLLVPDKFADNHTWEVSPALVKKFCRCLSPDSDLVTMSLPQEVTKVQLTGKVHALDGDVATLSYAGHIAAVHPHPHPAHKGKTNWGQAGIQGAARYDLKKQQMLSVTFVLDGVFHNFQPYHKQAHAILAGMEWQYKTGAN